MKIKKQPFKLTAELGLLWKQCVIGYLTGLYGAPIPELSKALMEPGVLQPMFKYKYEVLLLPGQKVMKAYFLKKGAAKLFVYDENNEQAIHYIWNSGSIIVLYKEFREKISSEDFYIELLEDSELVSISSMNMDDIYEKHTLAYELTLKILALKTAQRKLHMEILQSSDKLRRYGMFKEKFAWLFANGKCRLGREDLYAFLDISESTLKDAKRIWPDEVMEQIVEEAVNEAVEG